LNRLVNVQAQIEDARPIIDEFTLDRQGFEIMNLESKMTYEDFQDDAKIVQVYLSEVADALRDLFGASYVQIFEYIMRKRHKDFPIATGEPYQWKQPTSMAHVDKLRPTGAGHTGL
jgi:hypothetical protein